MAHSVVALLAAAGVVLMARVGSAHLPALEVLAHPLEPLLVLQQMVLTELF